MAFNDLIEALDNTCLSTFGETALFLPQSLGDGAFDTAFDGNFAQESGDAITITGITSLPPMLEDVLTGGTPGVVVLYFFVRFVDIDPNPKRGDTISYGGASYDIADVLVDRSGGALLKLRRNA